MSESSFKSQMFTCIGFAEAMSTATDETSGAIKAAMRSAMNKVVKSVQSLTSSEIRKVYNVPKNILDARLTMFTARMSNLEAELVIGGKSVSLSYFGARQFAKKRVTTRKGMTTRKRSSSFQGTEVEVFKGQRTELKSAFMQTFKSGHIGVMTRTSKARYPVMVKSAISIASMFEHVGINDAIVAKIDADLEATFLHELEFFLERGN
jgi:hypothetical protein